MKLSETAIHRPVFTWMLMAALIIFGALSFRKMGISQYPDVDFPTVSVSIDFEGASPETVETEILDPIESALMSIQGIKNLESTARMGRASVNVEFDLDKNIDVAVQEVQTVLAHEQGRLPEGVDPPRVSKRNFEDRPILWLSVNSTELPSNELMSLVRDRIRDQFTTIPGVAEVFMGGYVEPSLRVWLSADKLNQYAFTVDDVLNAIQTQHKELPAGRIENDLQEKSVRLIGEAESVEEFKNLVITRRGGAPNFRITRLGEIAEVEDGLSDVRRVSRADGRPTVGLGIIKQRGANAVEVAKLAREKAKEIQPTLPADVKISPTFDSTEFIEESVDELVFTLILSAILTAVVCWLFLGSWSATMNVVLAIPTSVIGSFIVLSALDFTLNTFTLLGLSLAIGIVVDDAIMVLENIVRHREKGETRLNAALLGSREIAFAAMAATAAIIAIFLPVAFVEGIIGKFFFQFGLTLSVAVALSLLEALTLTPMRCSQFLQSGERSTRLGRVLDAGFDRLAIFYRKVLDVSLANRWKVVIGSLLLFVLSLGFLGVLKREFVPAQDEGSLRARFKTPEGSSLQYTSERLKEAEKVISDHPAVDRYFLSVGGFGGTEVNSAFMFITLKDRDQRPVDAQLGRRPSQVEVANMLREKFKNMENLEVFIQESAGSSIGLGRGFPVSFTVKGPDWDKLVEFSTKMQEEMKQAGLMRDVHSDYVTGIPEVQIHPDRRQAALHGVSISEIAQTLNVSLGGVVAGLYTKGGHRYDIRVRLRPEERNNVEDIQKLFVRNNRGELVRLSDLVQIQERSGPLSISRENRNRAISVYANVTENSSQAEALNKVHEIASRVLPQGYFISESGGSKMFGESFQGLLFAFWLSLLIAYMVLASQFNSFVHPITVLMALPFSVSGAFVALWLGGESLNIFSFIGIILLTGIVKKNSIMLVDFTNQVRARGVRVLEALKEACPIRLRPILMTSVATIAAAVPPALSFGPGAESRIPMAISVIGGVTVSTLLTLFVVPCVYSLFSRKGT